MVWNSIALMTIIDVVIVSFIIYIASVFYRRRKSIRTFRATLSVFLILSGLGMIALFYLADLAIMYVLPLLIPMMQAMELMEFLHLNILWYVMVIGVTFMGLGVLRLVHIVFPRHLSQLEGLKDVQENLSHLATIDPLTGLLNRRKFKEDMDKLFSQQDLERYQFAILFIDLDGFKPINDTIGHDAGDIVLINVAKRLKDNIRHSDSAVRYGGDEFIVCLKDIVDLNKVAQIAEQLVTSIAVPIDVNESSQSISVSIGISTYPEQGGDIDTMVKHADSAMYDVKRSGGNGFAFYKDCPL